MITDLKTKKSFTTICAIICTILLFSCSDSKKGPIGSTDDTGNIDLNDMEAVINNIDVVNGSVVTGDIPEETNYGVEPEISFNTIFVNGKVVQGIQMEEENYNLLNGEIPFIAMPTPNKYKFDDKSKNEHIILNKETMFETIIAKPGDKLTIVLNVSDSEIFNYSPKINIGLTAYNKKYFEISNITLNGDLASFEMSMSDEFRPGVLNCNISLSFSFDSELFTTEKLDMDILIIGTLNKEKQENITGDWEIIKQSPAPGTVLFYHELIGTIEMPSYIGHKMIFYADGTGDNGELPDAEFYYTFKYRFVTISGDLVLDFTEVFFDGKSYPGSKFTVYAMNNTSLILDELVPVEGNYIKRYIELKRLN